MSKGSKLQIFQKKDSLSEINAQLFKKGREIGLLFLADVTFFTTNNFSQTFSRKKLWFLEMKDSCSKLDTEILSIDGKTRFSAEISENDPL